MNRRFLLKTAAASSLFTGAAAAMETPSGAHLYHRDWGTGRPIIFVHSWALNCDMWQYQMMHLASHGLRTVAYDTRGHGRSSDPGRGYGIDSLADDLATVMDRLNLRNAILVGHSMGCGQVVRYLTRHGASRVAKAVFVAPALPFAMKTQDNPDGIDKQVLDQVRAAICTDFPKWLKVNSPGFFAPDTPPETVQWGIQLCQQTSMMALAETNRANCETDFRSELRKVTVKTLIIHGDRDLSAPLERTGRRVAQLIPGSELKVYEGGPHGLFISHMSRLNQDLLDLAQG